MRLTNHEIEQMNKANELISKQGFRLISIEPIKKSLTQFRIYAYYGKTEEVSIIDVNTVRGTYKVIWHSVENSEALSA